MNYRGMKCELKQFHKIMEKMNIKKNITLALILFSGLIYSCSGDDSINVEPINGGDTDDIYLSMALNSNDQQELRAGGNYDNTAESRIYSLEVLIFKDGNRDVASDGTGGYKSIPRTMETVSGQNYDKQWKEINEIKGIKLTAGERDVYVIANAPDNSFSGINTLAQFKDKFEELERQGYGLKRAHPPGTTVTGGEGNPIGGIDPDGLHTNLTMCHFGRYKFSNQHTQHYLGYTNTTPTPGVPSGGNGLALEGAKAFEVERLVARVALSRVTFDLTKPLTFEGESITKDNYTYQLDSVFLINAKTAIPFSTDGNKAKVADYFGYGCGTHTYNTYLTALTRSQTSKNAYSADLFEEIYTPNYDIGTNSSPIWFYTFENDGTQYPTYLVIGVRFNYKKADNTLKTAKYYYPIIVNKSGTTNLGTDNHKYIKRNVQYSIGATIKGLGTPKYPGEVGPLLRSSSDELFDDSAIEVEEEVGRNLFPWTGNKYISK